MLSQINQAFNRSETIKYLALARYTVLALEEEIAELEKSDCGDMEMMSGVYGKLDEAKERVRYFKNLLG